MLTEAQKGRLEKQKTMGVLKELKDERNKQKKGEADARARLEAVEREQSLRAIQEEARQREMRDLRGKEVELQEALKLAELDLAKETQEHAQRHTAAVAELHDNAKRKMELLDEALLRIPSQLKQTRGAVKLRQEEVNRNRYEKGEQYQSELKGVKDKQGTMLHNLNTQWTLRMTEAEARHEELIEEFAAVREREQRTIDDFQQELVNLFDTSTQLTQIVADVEDGVYTSMRRGGQKEAILPEGLKPALPTHDTYPGLFGALEKADQKVTALERAAQRPVSAGRLRHSIAAASGRYDSVELLSAVSVDEDLEGLSAVGGSTASLPPRPSSKKATPMASPFSISELNTCARELCDAQSQVQTERMLLDLSTERLRQLCLELRRRSLQVFAPSAEREALRKEALLDLEDEVTTRYMQDLERRRDEERAAFVEATEREHQLRKVLESRRENAFSSRQLMRTNSASSTRPTSRSNSRQPTATSFATSGSRSGSRPPTASRPPVMSVGAARGSR